MKKILLLIAGAGALVAIIGGMSGLNLLIGLGAGGMVIALILLGWLKESYVGDNLKKR